LHYCDPLGAGMSKDALAQITRKQILKVREPQQTEHVKWPARRPYLRVVSGKA
jgi:hypothetical protein